MFPQLSHVEMRQKCYLEFAITFPLLRKGLLEVILLFIRIMFKAADDFLLLCLQVLIYRGFAFDRDVYDLIENTVNTARKSFEWG